MATAQLPLAPTTPRKRTDLVYGMTGQNPAFSPPATANGNPTMMPPSYTLPANYNFNDLANYESTVRNKFGQTSSDDILSTRDNLAKSLGTYGADFFKQQNPAILEDLNSRGLLTSPSEVANKETEALKSIALENSKYLRDFDTSALSARLQGGQDALDAGLDLRRGGLEQANADSRSNSEMDLAKDLAAKSGRNQLTGALIGAGGSILGAGLPELIKSGLAKKAATTVAGKVAPTLLADAGTADVAGTPAAAGLHLGAGAGSAAIVGAGIGSAMLSRAAEKRAGGGTAGTIAGTIASPIGQQLNMAKDAISKVMGAGKTGVNVGDQQRGMNDLFSQATQLKQLADSGQIDPTQYGEALNEINKQAITLYHQTASKGGKPANEIRNNFAQFLKNGFISQAGNDAYASNFGSGFKSSDLG